MSQGRDADEWLMSQVARGRRECLAPLVRRYISPLLTFATRMVGDRHTGEELVQEVFLTVWLKRGQYRYPRPVRPWLFAIAANQCRASFRRRKDPRWTYDETAPGGPASREASPEQTAILAETTEIVSDAVAQLPPQQRQVVVLRVWNGLSYQEIGQIIGATEAAARSHMHHGVTALRQRLGRQFEKPLRAEQRLC